MFFISEFLMNILEFIYRFIGNYGWSVILFTLVVKTAVLPFDVKQKRSMRKMTAVQPKMTALQNKYKNDQETLNRKLNELYRKEGISPMAGCLPMILSMVILFCMFDAMRVFANMQTVQMVMDMQAGTFDPSQFQSFMWIKNVFQPDSFMSTIIPSLGDTLAAVTDIGGNAILTKENIEMVRAFLQSPEYATFAAEYGAAGTYVYQANMLFWTIQIPTQFNGLFLLPVIAAVTSFLSSKVLQMTGGQSNANDQAQATNKMMMWMMPIMSLFFCASSSAAFALYWVMANVIQIAQQLILNWYFSKEDAKKPEEVV